MSLTVKLFFWGDIHSWGQYWGIFSAQGPVPQRVPSLESRLSDSVADQNDVMSIRRAAQIMCPNLDILAETYQDVNDR